MRSQERAAAAALLRGRGGGKGGGGERGRDFPQGFAARHRARALRLLPARCRGSALFSTAGGTAKADVAGAVSRRVSSPPPNHPSRARGDAGLVSAGPTTHPIPVSWRKR